MTRQEIEASYTVVDGVIRTPGKFEGEPVYVPYFWDAILDGCGESLDFSNSEHVEILDVTDEDRQQFPELDPAIIAIALTESDQGFVYCELMTEKRKNKLFEQYEKDCEENADSEGTGESIMDMVRIPRDLLARLMAAIETPADLSDDDKIALLEETDRFYPHENEAA